VKDIDITAPRSNSEDYLPLLICLICLGSVIILNRTELGSGNAGLAEVLVQPHVVHYRFS